MSKTVGNNNNKKNLHNTFVKIFLCKNYHFIENFEPIFTMPTLFPGNRDTLERIPRERGIDVRQELLKFHQKWYSANIMTLIVVGKGVYGTMILTHTCIHTHIRTHAHVNAHTHTHTLIIIIIIPEYDPQYLFPQKAWMI